MKKLILLITPLLLLVACKKEYAVERSIVIDAPQDVVWQQVKYFENWQNWSPWYANDSTMEWTFEGEDGTVESSYAWSSENSGSGKMVNSGMTEGERLNYHTHFMEPWESETDGYVALASVEGGTEVTWGFSGEMKFPMSMFMNMDKMVGPDFEKGLALLKTTAESMPTATEPSFDIQTIDYEGVNCVGYKALVSFQDMKDFFDKSYGKLMGAIKMKEGAFPMGFYYTWDEEAGNSEMAAALPVEDMSMIADDMEAIVIPPSKALFVDYFGSYEGSEAAHMAISNYMEANALEYNGPAIEVYVTDPMMEPDTAKWHTKIIYPIK